MLRGAQAAALELGHGYVGCEHLLLGMLREEEDAPGRALRALGAEEEKTRALITRALGRGEADLAIAQGLSPHARCAVEMAVAEAERSGSREIESGHLLLGMLRCGDNTAVRLLQREGVDTRRLYGETVRAMSLTARRSPGGEVRASRGESKSGKTLAEFTRDLTASRALARRRSWRALPSGSARETCPTRSLTSAFCRSTLRAWWRERSTAANLKSASALCSTR